MEKIILILLFTTPFVGFGQNQESSDNKNMFHVSDVLFYDPCKYDTLVFLKEDNSRLTGIVYSKYGQIGSFLNGIRYGLHRNWDENGKLSYECEFINGKKNGTEKFYEDGKVRYLTEYKDDKRHGIYKSWKNGNLFMETNFKNDVYDGFSKVFNYKWTDYGEKIGDLVSIGDFKNGKKNGVWLRYSRGKPWKFELYRDNELIDEYLIKKTN